MRSRTPACIVSAHAKVNLDLRVFGLRGDGYHDLRTMFQTIELHDSLRFDARPGPFEISCDVPDVPLDRSNLVWKAAARLWTALGRAGEPADVAVTIEKSIPMQAGLGGGSADAAAALQGLARVWSGTPPAGLADIAAGLGADVAFFLSGGTGLGLGRGDDIYPLIDLPPHPMIIVQPPFGVSTAAAYGWFDADRAAGLAEEQPEQILPGPWQGRAARMCNDLEAPVVRRHPEIGALTAALRNAGAIVAAMSGSGSAVFGLFDSVASASGALEWVSRTGATGMLTRTVGRAEYRKRSRPRAALAPPPP